MFKRLLSIVLSLIILSSVISCSSLLVSAEKVEITDTAVVTGTTGDCTWEVDGTKLTISGNGAMDNYRFNLASPWSSSITKVIISDGVTNIGDYAFERCTKLTSVSIGNSVTSIGSYAFENCNSLKSITIGNSVTSIGSCSFHFCSSLYSVTIGDSVRSIDRNAFEGCSLLTSLIIGDSIEYIGDYAFCGCKNMSSVILPNSVTSIGSYAFSGCKSITTVNIPHSIESIDSYAFSGCTNLSSVIISDTVPCFGKDVFSNTAWYNNQPEGLVYIGKFAYKMKGTCPADVEIKGGTLGVSDYAFDGCTSLTSVTIPDSVKIIGSNAFSGCKCLTAVDIPDSVERIENCAFSSCYSLTSVIIGNSVKRIGSNTFSGCKSMTSVSIGNSVESIGDNSFYNCSSLTSVVIPDSVKSIGNLAFSYCSSITSVAILSSEISIGNFAFLNCSPFTIYGYYNTTAQYYAEENSIPFMPVQKCENCHGILYKTDYIQGFPATCTEEGLTDEYTCPTCGYQVVQTVIPALGHKPIIDKAVEATCQHAGHTLGSYCERCREVYIQSQMIPQLPHTVVIDNAVPADCTHTGLTEGKHCSVCNEVIAVQEVIPITHKSGDPVKENIINATCTSGGSYDTVAYCTICGEEIIRNTMTVKALGHNYVYLAGVSANSEQKGLTEGIYCSRCGEWLIEQEPIPRTGYSLQLGDADCDEQISVIDATFIQYNLAELKKKGVVNKSAADVDKNGEIEVVDSTHILRHVAGIPTSAEGIGQPVSK